MQIAALSDVHGNLPALTAVWLDIVKHDLAHSDVLNAGDNVCYGHYPEETIEFIRSHQNILSVQGNYDRSVALFPEKVNSYRK